MATSPEKVRALGDRLPELVQQLGLGGLMAGVVAMAMPMLEGEFHKLAAMDPAELDDLLDQVATFVVDLMSDTGEAACAPT